MNKPKKHFFPSQHTNILYWASSHQTDLVSYFGLIGNHLNTYRKTEPCIRMTMSRHLDAYRKKMTPH